MVEALGQPVAHTSKSMRLAMHRLNASAYDALQGCEEQYVLRPQGL